MQLKLILLVCLLFAVAFSTIEGDEVKMEAKRRRCGKKLIDDLRRLCRGIYTADNDFASGFLKFY
jgi:hypothetical protein